MHSVLNRIYVRQKCAGCWGHVVSCCVGLTTDVRKKIMRGCYSPRATVLPVVASKGDKCLNTAHPSIDQENSAPLI